MTERAQLLLPIEAQNRFAKAAEENQKIRLIIDSQQSIIDDVEESQAEEEKLVESIQKIEEEIKIINNILVNSHQTLTNILYDQEGRQAQNENNNVSEILKIILPSFQNLIFDLCSDAASNGSTNISITTIFELEQRIIKIIESLKQRGVYPETDEQALKGLEELQSHQQRIHTFINSFIDAPNQS